MSEPVAIVRTQFGYSVPNGTEFWPKGDELSVSIGDEDFFLGGIYPEQMYDRGEGEALKRAYRAWHTSDGARVHRIIKRQVVTITMPSEDAF